MKILCVALVVMFASGAQAASENLSRKDAKAQSYDLRFPGGSSFAPLRLCGGSFLQDALAIEVFQVMDLPLNVHEASLVKVEKGYLLKLVFANSSESKMIGIRYSLVTIDSRNQAHPIANRTEGFSVPAYATKTLTFKTPIRFKPKGEERLALMLEQVISRDSIWEVVKAKEAFDSYAKGDYSVVTTVLRVANQVDSPPMLPRLFRNR